MKFTIWYEPSGLVYAYTSYEKFAKRFQSERKLRGFLTKKVKMTEEQAKSFQYLYRNKQLIDGILTDGEKDFSYIMTVEEESKMEDACDHLMDRLIQKEIDVLRLPLSDKYWEYIKVIRKNRKKENPRGKYNTFELFTRMYASSIL